MFIKNSFFFLMIIAALFSSWRTQAQPIETVIKTQAMDMARAVLAKDLDKLILYMPPRLVASGGGKEKLLVARDSVNKYMKQFGAEVKKITIGNPGKIIAYKNQLQTTVPQTTEASFMTSRITLESVLVAISEDKGLHWYFVDTSIYRGDKLKTSLPDLSPELVIPPMKAPKITGTEQ